MLNGVLEDKTLFNNNVTFFYKNKNQICSDIIITILFPELSELLN